MNEKQISKKIDELYYPIRNARALVNSIIEHNSFTTDMENKFHDVFALSELCKSELTHASVAY